MFTGIAGTFIGRFLARHWLKLIIGTVGIIGVGWVYSNYLAVDKYRQKVSQVSKQNSQLEVSLNELKRRIDQAEKEQRQLSENMIENRQRQKELNQFLRDIDLKQMAQDNPEELEKVINKKASEWLEELDKVSEKHEK